MQPVHLDAAECRPSHQQHERVVAFGHESALQIVKLFVDLRERQLDVFLGDGRRRGERRDLLDLDEPEWIARDESLRSASS
jgi:hypothetical protein